MNQRDAVFEAVKSVAEVNGAAVTLTKEQKAKVHAILVDGFLAGTIEYRGTGTKEEFAKYVPGLVNNWLRKDKRLNGAVKYVPKNPGSRTGSGDATLQAMKALLASTSDPEAKIEIQAAIDARKAELRPKVQIDVNNLPESLRKFVAA